MQEVETTRDRRNRKRHWDVLEEAILLRGVSFAGKSSKWNFNVCWTMLSCLKQMPREFDKLDILEKEMETEKGKRCSGYKVEGGEKVKDRRIFFAMEEE